MNVAILCPGSSLSHFDGPDGYAQVIGVNRAATRFRCDVWAAGDYPLIERERYNVIGSPILYTAANSAAWLRDNRKAWSGQVVEFESFYDGSEQRLQWTTFTLTAAIWFAASRGGTSIRVFGADWNGLNDFDGVVAGLNRSESRWELESNIFRNVASHWRPQGVAIERVAP